MTHRITSMVAAAVLMSLASTASAACMTEYKAKQDNPLRLEHDTVEIDGPCTVEGATKVLSQELSERGWTLLKVLSVSES